MQPDSEINWDPSQLPMTFSSLQKFYVLFLLVAVCVGIVKTVVLWIPAPPFRLSRQASNPAYVLKLRKARNSLKQWIGCVLLGGTMVAVINIGQRCHHMLEAKASSNMTFVFAIRDLAAQFSATFVVAFFFFLLQWYVLWRMDRMQS